MRLAFCFISNTDDGLRELIKYFKYDCALPPYVVDSYSKNILINPPLAPDCFIGHDWNVEWRAYISFPVLDMFSLRQDSFKMARNADIIYIGDDDMHFEYQKSSFVINECCEYMMLNQDCGAIYLGGNFGGEGDTHGNEIYITNKGHLGTNRGILVRNREQILLNRLHALGANFDAVVGFTCLLQGMYVARRLHVPIKHFTTNVMEEGHPNKFYDLEYLRTQGIMSKVNQVIGKWEDHAVWPENIFTMYRQAAFVRGFVPKYDIEGNIL
jgi:hypothetical protein